MNSKTATAHAEEEVVLKPLPKLGEYTAQIVGLYTVTELVQDRDFTTKIVLLEEDGHPIMKEKIRHRFRLELLGHDFRTVNLSLPVNKYAAFYRKDDTTGKWEYTLTKAGVFLQKVFGALPKDKHGRPVRLLNEQIDWEFATTCYLTVTVKPDTFTTEDTGEVKEFGKILDYEMVSDPELRRHNDERKEHLFAGVMQ